MLSGNKQRFVVPSVLVLLAGLAPSPDGRGVLGAARVNAAPPKALSKPATGDARPADRSADRTAIRAVMESFEKAFEARDAKALAAHWTAEGEYQNEQGAIVRGRGDLEKSFAEFFARTPEVKAEVTPKAFRFLSRDSAIEDGSVSIRRGSTEPATSAGYSALFAREDGKWLLAQLQESTEDATASVADLGWMIGEWKSAVGDGAEIRTTYSLGPNKKFVQSQFTIKEKDLALSGHQVIGVNPASGELHTWTFEADGGVGEAEWHRDGDHWVLDVVGTLADGRTLTETNILRRVNNDTFTWQSIDRMLGGEILADLPPVKVTRIVKGDR